MILARYTQQPGERLPRLIDFKTEWATQAGQTVTGFTVVADPGITVTADSLTDGVARILVSGGVDGVDYKVTVRATTTEPGVVREADIIIKVREA